MRSVWEFGESQQISMGFASWLCYSSDIAHWRHDVWPSSGLVHCIHFWGLLPPNGILRAAKFTLRPSLAFFYIGGVTAWHLSSCYQPNFVAWYKEWNYGTFAEGTTHLYSAGWPSHWASAHILLLYVFN